jgi:endonuclease/exonuclease/phosphatase (EEP) superfamily protein YafD
MRLLSWNCRGIGRAPTARSLKALVRDEGPDVLFLAETKVSSPRLEKLKVGMGFSNFFCVDSEGKARGLAIFWKLGVELEVVFSNSHIIAALVYSDPPDNVWLLLAVYGLPYFSKRKKFWNLMEDLISRFDGSWLMIGDLNSVSKCSEKKGGSNSAINSSRSFHHFVSEVGAIDLGFSGPKFT